MKDIETNPLFSRMVDKATAEQTTHVLDALRQFENPAEQRGAVLALSDRTSSSPALRLSGRLEDGAALGVTDPGRVQRVRENMEAWCDARLGNHDDNER